MSNMNFEGIGIEIYECIQLYMSGLKNRHTSFNKTSKKCLYV